MLSHFSHVQLFAAAWAVACQAPLSMGLFRLEYWGFSRLEYCSGLPHPSPGDLSNPGTEFASLPTPALHMNSSPLSHWGSPSHTTADGNNLTRCLGLQRGRFELGASRLWPIVFSSPLSETRDVLPKSSLERKGHSAIAFVDDYNVS